MSSISSQLIGMQSATAQTKAASSSGSSTEITSDDFLSLLLTQLQYQDPMNPVDNTEFLSQQAQFTQLSTIQEMSSNISSNNQITQACSLVGKDVTLQDPNDSTKTITGTVTSANFGGKNPTVTVNGKEYALGYVTKVNNDTTATTN